MRLIDADALREAMELAKTVSYMQEYMPLIDEVIGAIDDLPTIDAAPVRRGEWKYFHKQNRAVCTQCSFERDLDTDFGAAVSCPNCGADIRVEEHHEPED